MVAARIFTVTADLVKSLSSNWITPDNSLNFPRTVLIKMCLTANAIVEWLESVS